MYDIGKLEYLWPATKSAIFCVRGGSWDLSMRICSIEQCKAASSHVTILFGMFERYFSQFRAPTSVHSGWLVIVCQSLSVSYSRAGSHHPPVHPSTRPPVQSQSIICGFPRQKLELIHIPYNNQGPRDTPPVLMKMKSM